MKNNPRNSLMEWLVRWIIGPAIILILAGWVMKYIIIWIAGFWKTIFN